MGIRLRSGLCAALLLAALSPAASGQFGTLPSGDRLRELAPAGTPAVALFFVASDCPVSDRTFPEMKRIRDSFTPRRVRVLFVYPNQTERRSEVEAHQRAFDPGGSVLFDPAGELLRLASAKVTPEVSVLVPAGTGWRPVYTGRIDDRSIHIGIERPRPTRFFAEEALAAVLSGKPAPKAIGTPIGCGIVQAASPALRSRR